MAQSHETVGGGRRVEFGDWPNALGRGHVGCIMNEPTSELLQEGYMGLYGVIWGRIIGAMKMKGKC